MGKLFERQKKGNVKGEIKGKEFEKSPMNGETCLKTSNLPTCPHGVHIGPTK